MWWRSISPAEPLSCTQSKRSVPTSVTYFIVSTLKITHTSLRTIFPFIFFLWAIVIFFQFLIDLIVWSCHIFTDTWIGILFILLKIWNIDDNCEIKDGPELLLIKFWLRDRLSGICYSLQFMVLLIFLPRANRDHCNNR